MDEFLETIIERVKKSGDAEKYYSIVGIGDKGMERVDFTPGNEARDSYSVAKSVTGMAAVILCDNQVLSLDDTIERYLGEYIPDGSSWGNITLDRLMHHCTGAKTVVDFDLENAERWDDREWLHTLFSYEREGDEYAYSDGNFYIVSRIVEKLCGRDLDSFAEQEIFNPLGFHQNAWSRDVNGHTIGGSGLFMRTEDMAKLALLCMNDGEYEGRRIFSKEAARLLREGEPRGYGIFSLSNGGFCARGMYGQGYYFNLQTRHACAWHSRKTDGLTAICEEIDK